jgi:hypothetical protein
VRQAAWAAVQQAMVRQAAWAAVQQAMVRQAAWCAHQRQVGAGAGAVSLLVRVLSAGPGLWSSVLRSMFSISVHFDDR